MTITIYHFGQSRSLRVMWLLEEMGQPYELKSVPMAEVQQFAQSPEYLAVNPLGKFPAMQDGDMTMVESIAIMDYLMTKYDAGSLKPAADHPDLPAFLQWLHFGEAGIAPYLTMLMGHTVTLPEEQRVEGIARWGKKETMRCLDFVSKGLGARDYLCPSGFTAADISVFYMLLLLRLIKQFDDVPENIKAYYDRLKQRPAWQATLARSKDA